MDGASRKEVSSSSGWVKEALDRTSTRNAPSSVMSRADARAMSRVLGAHFLCREKESSKENRVRCSSCVSIVRIRTGRPSGEMSSSWSAGSGANRSSPGSAGGGVPHLRSLGPQRDPAKDPVEVPEDALVLRDEREPRGERVRDVRAGGRKDFGGRATGVPVFRRS